MAKTKIAPDNGEAPPAPSPRDRLLAGAAALKASLIERDEEVDLALTALLAGEHLLLVGPPGTAKSALLGGLGGLLAAPQFSYLLTKFTDPAELFGPPDLPALKAGSYQRVTAGFLPDATLAFLDEVFKASSAILNTLLTWLNERRVRFGRQEIACPLLMCLGASNEWPDDANGGKELGALFDRFLFRKTVRPVSRDAGRRALLKGAVNHSFGVPLFKNHADHVTAEEVRDAQDEAADLPWGSDGKKALWNILDTLDKEGIRPGDRRTVKAVGAARAAAWYAGSDRVEPEHLEVLQHVLWDEPEEQPAKCARVVCKIANPTGAKILDLLQQADDVTLKSADYEAAAKLKEIAEELEALPASPRRDIAVSSVRGTMAGLYNKALGIRGKEDE